MPVEIENGFINITRRWDIATSVELQLLLPVRRVMANPQVENLRGMVALERGPLVYALEAADNEANVRDLMLADSSQLSVEHQPGLLGGITTISGQAATADGNAVQFTAIPYYAWGHRDAGEMTVWLRRR